MGKNSAISWCDNTHNFWIGCTHQGPGCTNCFAEREDGYRHWTSDGWGKGKPRHRTSEVNWRKPLAWNKQAEKDGTRPRVFCMLLGDFFDEEVPELWRTEAMQIVGNTPNLEWLILTKRIDKAVPYFQDTESYYQEISKLRSLPNVRLGITVCNQEEANRDVPKLLKLGVPNFLSIEPMLGPIDLVECGAIEWDSAGDESTSANTISFMIGNVDWIIVAGESGPNARPMHPKWVRSSKTSARQAGIPFHFKGWGEYAPCYVAVEGWICLSEMEGNEIGTRIPNSTHMIEFFDDTLMAKVGKKKAGAMLGGREWKEFPE